MMNYWQHNSKVQWTGNTGQWVISAASEFPGAAAKLAIMARGDQPNTWLPNSAVKWMSNQGDWSISKSIGVPPPVLMSMTRSNFRRVFGRIFGRIN
jgi:hypothetical protein